ncbi:MAG: DUF2007 domain-containing protein [Candidatus Eisenbacteria bacterium]
MTEERENREADVTFEVVYTANGEAEAHGVRTALDAAGIPTELKVASATKLFPVTVDGLGAVGILVPVDRLEEARAIIETPAELASSDE